MTSIQEYWLQLVAIGVPIAAFVAFWVHVITARKSALEIKKLKMEIAKLKGESDVEKSPIKIATFDQILRFADGRRSRSVKYSTYHKKASSFPWFIVFLVLLLLAYLLSG